LFPSPSEEVFNQKVAYWLSKKEHIIFICWRYEGIDYRCEAYLWKKYPNAFRKISLWEFIVLWWEVPSMVMIESIVRLIPWVIKEKGSWIDESYSLKENMKNLEAPNYTRPLEVFWMKVPEELLSWSDESVNQWRKNNAKIVDK
jgi:tRNA (guanine37-N1)-methyltransferase